MSGIEVVGLVLGAFPILLNCLDYYREGFEPLEEWWSFRTHFIAFIDDVRHQMMRYRENMIRLLDPIVTDTTSLDAMVEDPRDRRWSDDNLGKDLKKRLSSELDRFIRIVDRMHELTLELYKLLQIKDGKAGSISKNLSSTRLGVLISDQVSWDATGQQKPWEWHLRRLQISFSKRKQKKIDKLAKHNQELQEILGYSERIISVSDKKKASEPVSRFDRLRQHADAVHRTLANHWKCHRRCKNHAAHLSLRAEEVAVSLNVIFIIEGAQETPDMTWVEEVVIQEHKSQELPKSINIGYVRQSDPIKVLQRTVIQQEAASQANPSRMSQLPKILDKGRSALQRPWRRGKESSPGSANKKVAFRLPLPEPSVTSPSSSEQLPASSKKTIPASDIISLAEPPTDSLSANVKDLEPIADFCAFLVEKDQTTGILDDDDCNRALEFSILPRNEGMKVAGKAKLLSFTELLNPYQRAGINIPRRDRFEMATHIASALLQTYPSPWLSHEWTKYEFYFLVDIEHQSVCSKYPLLSRRFASTVSTTPPTGDDADKSPPPQQQSEQARACLFTLGVMVLELIFWKPIEGCDFRCNYFGVDGQPNDQTDVSTARHWQRQVLGDSGPEISEVVRRCLDCSFGPEPNFADVRFREAVYRGIIQPLADYAKPWKKILP